jgi:hypothetical protein
MSTISSDQNSEPIFSHRAHGDKRSFFFNVKRSPSGELCLTVSQFAKVAEEWVRLKLVIPAEDAKPFYQGLCEAIKALRQAEPNPHKQTGQEVAPASDSDPSEPASNKPTSARRKVNTAAKP